MYEDTQRWRISGTGKKLKSTEVQGKIDHLGKMEILILKLSGPFRTTSELKDFVASMKEGGADKQGDKVEVYISTLF
jgi:hypothetical protein